MIFHMAAVDISAFDSWDVLKECCTEKSPRARVVYLSTYILIQSICLCSHLVENLMEQMGAISKKIMHKKNTQRWCLETKSWQVLCADVIWCLCKSHLHLRCVALIWFSESWVKFESKSVQKFRFWQISVFRPKFASSVKWSAQKNSRMLLLRVPLSKTIKNPKNPN